MSDDELSYLQPGFDLSSLTVPRLRSILVSHDIPYPASAKKPQLIEILTSEVLPKSRKLLSVRAGTKRTSRGITDVASSQDSSTIDGDDDFDGELMPPPPPKTPRSRKSKSKLSSEDGIDGGATVATPSTSRRSRTPGGRKSTSKHPRASDNEGDADKPHPSSRKTRKSIPGPVPVIKTQSVKIEEPDHSIKRESPEKSSSPFTSDNPFQSGSSPSSEGRRVSSTSRTRKSLGSSSTDRRTSSSRKRQTLSPQVRQNDGFSAPSRSTFEFPVSKIKSDPDDIPVTEEFTPEEQFELVNEEAAQGRSGGQLVQRSPSRLVRRKKKSASMFAKSAPWAVLTTLFGLLGAWYRKEKIEIGYCGVGKPVWSLASNPQIPGWVTESFQPACEPCPQHAYCYPDMQVNCESNYLLQPHPLSVGGVIPLPPTCEPDGEKVKRIKAVANKAVAELRERRAAYECGGEIGHSAPPTVKGEEVKTVVKAGEVRLEIPEEELKQEVGKMRRKGMTEDEFEDLWQDALGDISSRDEVEVTSDGSGRMLLSSTSLARLPFTCAIRRSLLQSISRHRGSLALLILVSTVFLYARAWVKNYKEATAQIPSLVATTLDKLATQASLAADGRVDEGFLSIAQLRDDVLRSVFSARERERVWKGVRSVVEGNSNVRASNREGGRTGEWSRVWEWIGPVNLAPGLEGRRPGGIIEDQPQSARRGNTPDQSGGAGGKEMLERRNWDEGRPFY